jgi:urate oxidase
MKLLKNELDFKMRRKNKEKNKRIWSKNISAFPIHNEGKVYHVEVGR